MKMLSRLGLGRSSAYTSREAWRLSLGCLLFPYRPRPTGLSSHKPIPQTALRAEWLVPLLSPTQWRQGSCFPEGLTIHGLFFPRLAEEEAQLLSLGSIQSDGRVTPKDTQPLPGGRPSSARHTSGTNPISAYLESATCW